MGTYNILGRIPTSVNCTEEFSTSNPEDDNIFADIDTPEIIEMRIYPPCPMEFSIPTYSPREKKEAITYNEFYAKIFFMPPDAQVIIVRYDEQSKLFHIDPTEVVSLINIADDDIAINFYSQWYSQAKLIEVGQLQSATITDKRGDFWLRANDNGVHRIIPATTPLHLKGKVNTNCPIIDVVHFSGLTESSDERKLYVGIVVP